MGLGFFKDKTEKLMREISKLETTEFLGVCTMLNVPIFEEKGEDEKGEPRSFEDIWGDLCEKVNKLNRKQKRNLDKLVRAANKRE